MNVSDNVVIALLLLLGLVLSTGAVLVFLSVQWRRRGLATGEAFDPEHDGSPTSLGFGPPPTISIRPACWLAIRSRDVAAVQSALGLHNPEPCSWSDGLAATNEHQLFISPPVAGWILVFGQELPEPGEDVDSCFRFLLELSRKLGQVQFFSANRVLNHHAWAKVEAGRVVRAYAWAGKTLWHQGPKTQAEVQLGVKCFGYTETAERAWFGQPDVLAANVEKVPQLAARWSLDPAALNERLFQRRWGVAGRLPHSKLH